MSSPVASSSLPSLRVPADDSPTLSTLSDLPNELLLVIRAELHVKYALRNLRLVSRLYNEMAKDLVAESLILGRNLATIDGMASGLNIFDKYCRTLVLECSMFSADHYAWGMLANLITRMQGIHTIDCCVGDYLDPRMLDAICNLPALENLKLVFISYRFDVELALLKLRRPSLSKLKSLSIHLSPYKKRDRDQEPVDIAKGPLCYLLANTPALEHLDIGWITANSPWERPRLLDIDALFVYLQRRPNFASNLRSVNAGALKFPSPRMGGFFAQLSCLELPNDRGEHELVWPALTASGIRLETVKVKWLTPQLMDYLHGYHGLREFHMDICTPNGCYARDQDVQSLLTFALPQHHATLVDLRFLPSQLRADESRAAESRPYTMLWKIPSLLALLQPFARIERLDLVHFAVIMANDQEKVASMSNFNAIVSHSARLKTVYVHLVGVELSNRYRHNVHPMQNFHTFIQSITQFELGRQPPNWKELQVVVNIHRELRTASIARYPFPIARFAHKIVHKEQENAYLLAPDVTATEQLNDPDQWKSYRSN